MNTSSNEFRYMKEGLSTDIIDFLIADYHLDLPTALQTLYESDTYSKISEPSTGLYFQGSRYVYSYLQKELQNGTMG